jgi:hypothetical protein
MNYNSSDSIGEVVRLAETNFISGGGTTMSKHVVSDLYADINKIYAYLESTHITGATDSQNRKKPFFNIVLAARNIYYRATDLDRKNFEIRATKTADTVPAFLATVLLQNWMRKEDFGTFLNNWGMDLAGFNSSVVKFVEKAGHLYPMVVPWSRLIVDPINFDANPKIEILELTEAELRNRVRSHGYDKEMVDRLCEALSARELTDKTKQDTRNNYIKLYEIHLNAALSKLTDKEKDADTFVQQMHVISFVESKQKGEFDDFTLVSGREAQDPYMLTSLLPATDGSISLNGSVKNLFNAQWMMNHTVKSIKDQMDVSSKLLFQTADANYVGRNALTAVEQGDILVHAVNMPLTQVNSSSHDIATQQSYLQMWKSLASEINGVSESMLGNTAPSGTAWRQVEALLNESHSLFELMTENKALDAERMMRRFVIPFLKKQMDTSDEISAILESHNIAKIDRMYVPAEAARRFNQEVVQKTIEYLETDDDSLTPSPYQADIEEEKIKDELAPFGNQRFFVPSDIPNATWEQVVKDLEWDLEVDISGESSDKRAALETINTALVAVTNPNYANNPTAQMLVGKALSIAGAVSPLEISTMPKPQPIDPAQAGNQLPVSQ